MKNFYCFNCQREVEPKTFLGVKICPHCHHRIIDSGEGFYLVCDKCGADNPVSAKSCVKCRSHLNGNGDNDIDDMPQTTDFILRTLTDAIIFIIGFAFLIFIFYLSFYVFMALLILGTAYWLVSKTIGRIR